MNQGALLLALFSICSQVLGLVRDRALAHYFGPSETLDVYYAAFRIPDFLYNSFASLVAVTALLPLLAGYLKSHRGDDARAHFRDFSHSLFTVFITAMVVVCGGAFLLMKPLSFVVAPGFTEAQRELFMTLSRILLLSPIFLGLSNLFGSFSQAQKKFYAFALAPVFYNACILVGIFLIRPTVGITGVVIGAILGTVVHMSLQLPTLFRLGIYPALTLRPDFSFILKVCRTSISRTVSLSLSSITILVMGALASLLAAGSVSIFNFSYNIQTTPFYIVGISYAVAAFPILSRFYAEEKRKEFLEVIYKAAKNIFFFSIPLSLLFIVLRAQIVRVLLGSGQFSWNDTRLVAASLALFSLSIAAQSMVLLLSRSFYAMGDTKTPLRLNSVSVLITGSVAALLLWLYNSSLSFQYFAESLLRLDGIVGSAVIVLPLSFSIGQIINACLLWGVFTKRWKKLGTGVEDLRRMLLHICAAGILGAGVAYLALQVLSYATRPDTLLGIFIQGLLAGILGAAAYLGVIRLLDHNELKNMVIVITSKFWKQRPVAPEQPKL
ncbi:MAG TPA: murein biosynthesis integral membrane protein MurJ [Candidatus Paceibacterota bacterium]|nr:murein biosynthesis integral membrane protein MurJ [Candidatus Paceibacterota bacterium]